MMAVARPVCILGWALCVSALCGAEASYELTGQLDPPRGRVLVTLDGASSPYTAYTFSDSKGRFRFRDLAAGPYTLRMFVPGLDETQRTVEVSRSLADSGRRVNLTVPFDPSGSSRQAQERKHTVSARELSLPASAIREYKEAQVLLGKNEVGAAIKRLERAVEIAPQFTAAWNNLGTIAYHENRFADAERYFRLALEQEPGAYAPVVNLGGVLVTVGRHSEALEYNLYAIQQDPRDALGHAQLGMNYLFLNKLDLAIKHLKEAKRLDPSHFSHPQRYLAQIYARLGDEEAALAELEDFVRRHPDTPEAVEIRGRLSELKGR
jgi:tetratricopeptide (TPR) repeat protein